jgi:adenosylhomocysteinase
VEWLAAHRSELEARVYDVPRDIDDGVAELKLDAMAIAIDELTPAQRAYLASWTDGTK